MRAPLSVCTRFPRGPRGIASAASDSAGHGPDGLIRHRPAVSTGLTAPLAAVAARTHDVVMTNKIDYFEIGSPDPAASRSFYGRLFDWEIEEQPSGDAPYRMVDGPNGGLWDTSDIGRGNWAIFYVHGEDVRAAIDQAQQLGASIAIPFTDNGGIEFAHLVDPLGNRFGIWRPKAQ